ncbi:MAG TPA: hypothetical protein VGG74_20260 [Kofleriaceae bacterium]
MKTASSLVGSVSATVHVAEPEHVPYHQSENCQPVAGTAVSVTTVPYAKLSEHELEQSSIPGITMTVPCPSTLTLKGSVAGSKRAVTVSRPEPIVIVHVAEPVQPPLQPANTESVAGVEVSETTVPGGSAAEQPALAPVVHVMPADVDETLPLPSPSRSTASEVEAGTNVADTAISTGDAGNTTAHVVAEPAHAPLQPANTFPASGVALSVTVVPTATVIRQPPATAAVHALMPAGLELTLPEPPA